MATRTEGRERTQVTPPGTAFWFTPGAKESQPTTDEDLELFATKPLGPEEVARSWEILYGEESPVLVSRSVTLPGGAPFVRIVRNPAAEPAYFLANELIQVREKLKALEDRVALLTAVSAPIQERVIVLRSISREEAKSEIVNLFQTGGVYDYGEIAEKLRIDLPLVVDICNELEREGLIGESA